MQAITRSIKERRSSGVKKRKEKREEGGGVEAAKRAREKVSEEFVCSEKKTGKQIQAKEDHEDPGGFG